MRTNSRLPNLIATVSAACVFALSACGSGDTPEVEGVDASTTSTTTQTSVDDSTGAAATTKTTTGETSPPVLAGEEFDGFADEGDVFSVVGVKYSDTLVIRKGPGTDMAEITTADPFANNLVATGNARQLSKSIWYEVVVNDVTGWASSGFLAFAASTDDSTAEYLEDNDRASAETMVELGSEVAENYASDDPPSKIVQSGAAGSGDVAEITYDVIGLGDDSVAGYRLHIFAAEDDNGETLSLRTIERTTFCSRGVSGELCT